jgi:hypothetical protein
MFAKVLTVALFLVLGSNPCFALWGIAPVSKEQAKEMGMEVRSHAAGPAEVRVELEFKSEGELKTVSEVNLRFNDGGKTVVTAPLREDRSNPGRIVVSFTADRARLDKLTLWVMCPGSRGGTVFELKVKDFVDLEKLR